MFDRARRVCVVCLTAAVCRTGWAPAGEAGADKAPGVEGEQKAWEDSQLGGTQFKGVLAGAVPQRKQLRGSVVLLVYSDFYSQACRKAATELSGLAGRYRSAGLIVVGVSVPAEVKSKKAGKTIKAALKRATWPVVKEAKVPDITAVKTVPHLVLFNHEGRVVYEGPHSSKVMPVLGRALKARPHPLLGRLEFKKLAAVASMVKAGRLGAAYTRCRKKEDEPGATGEEARHILTRLDRCVEEMFKEADDYLRPPSERVRALQQIRKAFSSSEPGERAARKLREWMTQQALRNELEAENKFLVLQRAAKPLGNRPKAKDKDKRKNWDNRHAATLKALQAALATLRKKYPFTWGLRKAEELVGKLTK